MHARSSSRQGMMLFLIHQFARELQGGADVLDGQLVFPLHFLEAHASGQTADDDGDRRTRTTNNRLAVTNGGINRNSVIHLGPQSTPCPMGYASLCRAPYFAHLCLGLDGT